MIHIFAEEEKRQEYIAWMTELTNGQADISEGDLLYLEQKLVPKA